MAAERPGRAVGQWTCRRERPFPADPGPFFTRQFIRRSILDHSGLLHHVVHHVAPAHLWKRRLEAWREKVPRAPSPHERSASKAVSTLPTPLPWCTTLVFQVGFRLQRLWAVR